MARITLRYDARNRLAKKTIDYILSLGIFKVEEKSPYDPDFVEKVLESKKQAKEGKVTRVKKENLKEFLGL